MPKYLFQATYSAEGIKGLEKDKAAGRKAALSEAVESLGGKLEALYWAFGHPANFPTRFAASAQARQPQTASASAPCRLWDTGTGR